LCGGGSGMWKSELDKRVRRFIGVTLFFISPTIFITLQKYIQKYANF
jgi:hypothetical protein